MLGGVVLVLVAACSPASLVRLKSREFTLTWQLNCAETRLERRRRAIGREEWGISGRIIIIAVVDL